MDFFWSYFGLKWTFYSFKVFDCSKIILLLLLVERLIVLLAICICHLTKYFSDLYADTTAEDVAFVRSLLQLSLGMSFAIKTVQQRALARDSWRASTAAVAIIVSGRCNDSNPETFMACSRIDRFLSDAEDYQPGRLIVFCACKNKSSIDLKLPLSSDPLTITPCPSMSGGTAISLAQTDLLGFADSFNTSINDHISIITSPIYKLCCLNSNNSNFKGIQLAISQEATREAPGTDPVLMSGSFDNRLLLVCGLLPRNDDDTVWHELFKALSAAIKLDISATVPALRRSQLWLTAKEPAQAEQLLQQLLDASNGSIDVSADTKLRLKHDQIGNFDEHSVPLNLLQPTNNLKFNVTKFLESQQGAFGSIIIYGDIMDSTQSLLDRYSHI